MTYYYGYVVWRWFLWIGVYSAYGFVPGIFVAAYGYVKTWAGVLGGLGLIAMINILPIVLDRSGDGGLYNALLDHPFSGFPAFGWILSCVGFAIAARRR